MPSVEAEEHFKVLKSKLIDLLKLSEQIKRSKANIAGTPVADIELSNHQSKVIDIGSFGGEIS